MQMTIFPHMTSRKSSIEGMTTDEFSDVALFRERVEKLVSSQRKYQGLPISGFRTEPDGEGFVFEANMPDIDEVANLALKFRFFYADKEPTQFQKILSKVRHKAQDDWAHGYLDWLLGQYKTAMKDVSTTGRAGLPTPNRKVLDLWFNSEFFHSEPEKRKELQDIHDVVGMEVTLFQVYTAIARCASFIRMFYMVVHRLDEQHQHIYTPNHHFRQTPSGVSRKGGT